jgi:hypothetical protein
MLLDTDFLIDLGGNRGDRPESALADAASTPSFAP